MKLKRLSILALVVLMKVTTYGQLPTDYYYYQGKKIPLTLNENKVCVNIAKDCNSISKRIQTNANILLTIKDDLSDIYIISRSDFEQLRSLDFWEEDAKSVMLTSLFFTENNEEVCTTPYLNVRLKKEQDIDLLTSYAENYKLKIVGNSQFMPLWYILNTTLDSEKSTLECANELYESGDFAAAVPDLASITSNITVVHNISTTMAGESSVFFTLQGRRLAGRPSKGVYIQDGKKKVVR